jgi:SAM-dependent methyltransferase
MTQEPVRHYDVQYGQFATDLYAQVRAEAFGEDIGQNSWLTADEHDLFIGWLDVGSGSKLLDVASGSGRTTLRVAQITGCSVHGIDSHPQAVAAANDAVRAAGLEGRAAFQLHDAATRMPFADASFDALICIDALNHLPNRAAVFAEWARIIRPGGVVVFTDPITVTGELTAEEIAIRASIGFFLFVPAGYDETLLADAGFDVTNVVDRTPNMARTAQRRHDARAARAAALRDIEGDATFDGQQRFLQMAARLAAERRLSRFAFRAVRR